MKNFVAALFCNLCFTAFSQNIQLHYDPRHSIDPGHNAKNFPTIYFEYFREQDSGHAFIKPGSFLFKMQADLLGEQDNIGKAYIQASQTLRFWKPKVFLHLSYSGGLGITEPKQYSYYITNIYSVGGQYSFQWKGALLGSVLDYKYVRYQKPTSDLLYTLYWWKGFFNYKLELAGDFSIWTENKNHGDDYTKNMHGKRFSFFAEPQLLYNLSKKISMGSKVNMFYHVDTTDNVFQAYPTIAVKYKL